MYRKSKYWTVINNIILSFILFIYLVEVSHYEISFIILRLFSNIILNIKFYKECKEWNYNSLTLCNVHRFIRCLPLTVMISTSISRDRSLSGQAFDPTAKIWIAYHWIMQFTKESIWYYIGLCFLRYNLWYWSILLVLIYIFILYYILFNLAFY